MFGRRIITNDEYERLNEERAISRERERRMQHKYTMALAVLEDIAKAESHSDVFTGFVPTMQWCIDHAHALLQDLEPEIYGDP